MPSFVSGKQLQHGGGAQMRRRVPVDLERGRILRGQDLQARIGFERPLQIEELVVDFRDDRGVRQTGADTLRDVEGGGSERNVLDTSIGQSDVNIAHRGIFRLAPG